MNYLLIIDQLIESHKLNFVAMTVAGRTGHIRRLSALHLFSFTIFLFRLLQPITKQNTYNNEIYVCICRRLTTFICYLIQHCSLLSRNGKNVKNPTYHTFIHSSHTYMYKCKMQCNIKQCFNFIFEYAT